MKAKGKNDDKKDQTSTCRCQINTDREKMCKNDIKWLQHDHKRY